jgi:hypothetical protein
MTDDTRTTQQLVHAVGGKRTNNCRSCKCIDRHKPQGRDGVALTMFTTILVMDSYSSSCLRLVTVEVSLRYHAYLLERHVSKTALFV